MSRTTRTATIGQLTFDVYEPTDGQVAVLMQQARIAKRADTSRDGQAAAMAMGVVMQVVDNLIVDSEDRDGLAEEIIAGNLLLVDVLAAILGGPGVVDAEVNDAAPQTVIAKRRRKS